MRSATNSLYQALLGLKWQWLAHLWLECEPHEILNLCWCLMEGSIHENRNGTDSLGYSNRHSGPFVTILT
jgi:hypothetical protein